MKKGFSVLMIVVMLLGISAVPALADTPGTGSSDFIIQNVEGSAATVTVDYYDQSGVQDVSGTPISIPGLGSQVFGAGTLPVGDGWIGSVVIAADRDVAAVTKLTWDTGLGNADQRRTGAAYSGASTPRTELFFPYATVQPVGNIAGKLNRFSIITVQNAGTASANISMSYYNQTTGALTGPIADTIPAGRSKSYNLSTPGGTVPNLGSSWQGSVYVQCTNGQPIAGVVQTHWANQLFTQWASTYQGVSSGSTSLYGPSVFRFNGEGDPSIGSWVRNSNILVQNVGTSAATITVEFFEVGSSVAKMTINDTVQPKQMAEYNTRFGSPTNPALTPAAFEAALGNTYNGGSVVITSTNAQPLASVIHTFWWRPNENSASTYIASAGGASDLFVPYAPRKLAADWVEWSKIGLQNLSASAANITVTYRNMDGSQALQLTGSIPGKSTEGFNTRFGTDSGSYGAAAFAPLGNNFQGGVHISSSQPLVSVVNLIGRPLWAATYNAYVPE